MARFINTIKDSPLIAKILILVIIGGIAFTGYQKVSSSNQQKTQYQTTQAEKGTLIISVSASGQVSTANNSPVTTQAAGVAKQVFVKNSDEVSSGDRIAEIELDQNSLQKYNQALSSYQSAKNSLDSAQTNLWSLQSKLYAANQKFVNDAAERDLDATDPTYVQENADWLAAEATYKNQQNVIAQAQTSLNNAAMSLQQASPVIYAPISGTVSGLFLQNGSVIASTNSSSDTSTSSKIASIITAANPTVTANMTEIDITKLKIGNKATVTIDAFPDKTFTGKVVSIDTTGSVSSGVTSYPVVLLLDNQDVTILTNMSANANIITTIKDSVLLIPTAAVQTQNSQTTVNILKNGKVSTVEVQTGLSSDTQIEITSGLSEGDQVVTNTATNSTSSGSSRSSGQTQSPFGSMGGAVRIMH